MPTGGIDIGHKDNHKENHSKGHTVPYSRVPIHLYKLTSLEKQLQRSVEHHHEAAQVGAAASSKLRHLRRGKVVSSPFHQPWEGGQLDLSMSINSHVALQLPLAGGSPLPLVGWAPCNLGTFSNLPSGVLFPPPTNLGEEGCRT